MPAPRTTAVTRPESRRVERLLVGSHLGVKANALPFTPTRLYWRLRGVRLSRLVGRFTPTLAWYFLAVVLFFVGFAAFFAPLPLYLTGLDLGPGVVFGLYLVSSLGSAVCYTAAGELAGRHDVRTLHAAALGLRGVAIPVVAVVGAVVSAAALRLGGVALLFVVVGATWAVIGVTASTIVTRVAPATVRGEALGVYAALSTLAGGIGSLLGGALAARFGFLVTFAAAGLAVLAAAALIVRLREISTSAAGDRAAERPHPASAGESPR